MEHFLSAREAAKLASVSRPTMLAACRTGKVTAFRGSRQWFVVVNDDRWQQALTDWQRRAHQRKVVSEVGKRRWQEGKLKPPTQPKVRYVIHKLKPLLLTDERGERRSVIVNDTATCPYCHHRLRVGY